jgi:hypothetical protein
MAAVVRESSACLTAWVRRGIAFPTLRLAKPSELSFSFFFFFLGQIGDIDVDAYGLGPAELGARLLVPADIPLPLARGDFASPLAAFKIRLFLAAAAGAGPVRLAWLSS